MNATGRSKYGDIDHARRVLLFKELKATDLAACPSATASTSLPPPLVLNILAKLFVKLESVLNELHEY